MGQLKRHRRETAWLEDDVLKMLWFYPWANRKPQILERAVQSIQCVIAHEPGAQTRSTANVEFTKGKSLVCSVKQLWINSVLVWVVLSHLLTIRQNIHSLSLNMCSSFTSHPTLLINFKHIGKAASSQRCQWILMYENVTAVPAPPLLFSLSFQAQAN